MAFLAAAIVLLMATAINADSPTSGAITPLATPSAMLAFCINGADTVATPAGAKRIDQLTIGDPVAITKAQNGYVYEPIQAFLHRDTVKNSIGLRFTTASGRQFGVSHEHLVLLAPDSRSVFAKNVKVGDSFLTGTNEADKVIRVEPAVLEGRYSPLTKSGTILVNDISVSCYSYMEDHDFAHFVVQWLMTMTGDSSKAFETDGVLGRGDGLHTVASTMFHFFRNFFVAAS